MEKKKEPDTIDKAMDGAEDVRMIVGLLNDYKREDRIRMLQTIMELTKTRAAIYTQLLRELKRDGF